MRILRLTSDLNARLSRRISISRRRSSPANRTSSYPLISGDSFRCVADVIVDSYEDVPLALESLHRLSGGHAVLFSSAGTVATLLEALLGTDTSQVVLVIHNGDHVPSSKILTHCALFRRIYSVNWLAGGPVIPLPIGIENAWLRPGDHWEKAMGTPIRADSMPEARTRRHTTLVIFNDLTNPTVRKHAREVFRQVTGNMECKHLYTPSRYRSLVRDSLFVVSPPGNGPDCHRTWEAIYLGAVPIVLRSAWPFIDVELPVLCVESWDDALAQLAKNPRSLHHDISSRPVDRAMLSHYLGDILSD